MCPYQVFIGLCCPSCLFSSMSRPRVQRRHMRRRWLSSAARAAGVAGPAVVELSMSSRRRSMRREISACAGMASISKSFKCLKYWVVKCHCRPKVVMTGGVRSRPQDRGHAGCAIVDASELSHGSAFRVPTFLHGSSLCTGFPISQADHEQAIDGRVVVRLSQSSLPK
jgi:hypothetical protein